MRSCAATMLCKAMNLQMKEHRKHLFRAIRDGAVFRAVTRYDRVAAVGLSSQSVALIVKASVARAGGNAGESSGHSLRAGYCTSAAEKGLQPWQIREQTGHKSDITLAKYIRPVARRKIPSLL